MKRERIPDLISEIQDEMRMLEVLVKGIRETAVSLPKNAEKRKIYEESLALKLHNFYTGCERNFQKIASDINGGVPASMDWHRRLLKSMSLEIDKIRPPVISKNTEKGLEEFLAFRHVIRNIYGFEIESERLHRLTGRAAKIWGALKKDLKLFIHFLHEMAS